MPWINNEDAALKVKLQGITVVDANNPSRKVPVRYRLPEDELATLTYPCIIIEHLGLFPAPEREHSGYIQLGYAPEVQNTVPQPTTPIPVNIYNNDPVNGTWTSYPEWWPSQNENVGDPNLSPYYAWFPTPYNFDYQVTVYARKMPGHLQNIMNTLATATYLPYHFGYLNIPQDGTQRKLFVIGGPEISYGKDNNDKRLLKATYRVRVETELVLSQSFSVNGPYGQLVTQIDVDLGCYSDVTDLGTEEVSANFGLITTGPTYSFWDVEGPIAPAGTYPEGSIQPLPTFLPRRRMTQRAVTKGLTTTATGVTPQKIYPEE
jgi:hypothetical protein